MCTESTAAERIRKLRQQMKENGIDLYLIPTSDFHSSEYVGEYFKTRSYITGFTGSAGTAIVTDREAGLWTDGRYFIQAEKQLEGSGVTLFRSGVEGVPDIRTYLVTAMKPGQCLGFDGRVVTACQAKQYWAIAEAKHGRLCMTKDLVGEIWTDRPRLPQEPVWVLPEEYAGESVEDKLARLRSTMAEKGADVHILTSLYDIAWLLNIRGNDICHVPVVLSYVMVTRETCCLYLNRETLPLEVSDYLSVNGITVRDYNDVYADAESIPKDSVVLLDRTIVNSAICACLPADVMILDEPNPTERMKAIKNEAELSHTRQAHIRDGVAVTKFLYWLKTNIGKEKITERSAAAYLEERRREQAHFLDLSFDTISAYGANAAMMHYTATETSDAVLGPEGFLLVDSGGHYLDGTTDITRTIALGPLTREQKEHYTAVCRGNLNLANAVFLYGCTGVNLDILARGPVWERRMDYKCGTGHGVGHILNVHEGPNSIRIRAAGNGREGVLEPGMITTDEPGVYLKGQYGIRIENELLCQKDEKNRDGQFLHFENITFAPIDLDAILPEEMTAKERRELNDYHRRVYETLSDYLTGEERDWLRENTREI